MHEYSGGLAVTYNQYEQYIVRQLAQLRKNPTVLANLKLEHLAKYLKGKREWCWSYPFQDPPSQLDGFGDSDWAANVVTRKSVSCGVILHGLHFIESWVSVQQVVALRSGEAEFYASGKAIAHLRSTKGDREEHIHDSRKCMKN